MSHRLLSSIGILAVLLAPAPVAGQATPSETKTWTAPRTPDGQPDLQGLWTMATFTPLERPAHLAGKEFFTEQELAELEQGVLDAAHHRVPPLLVHPVAQGAEEVREDVAQVGGLLVRVVHRIGRQARHQTLTVLAGLPGDRELLLHRRHEPLVGLAAAAESGIAKKRS